MAADHPARRGTDLMPGEQPHKRVDLVFRRLGERTADSSLELAMRNLRPEGVHVIDGVRPFAAVVDQMLAIEHDCDVVVYLDADCLLLEDLRPFIDQSEAAFVDGRVKDRLRGRVRAGLHIARIDLVRTMAAIRAEPPADEEEARARTLRPESTLRHRALAAMGAAEQTKVVHVLHDHLQTPADLFAKAASRELRSRTPTERRQLEEAMRGWGADPDLRAARAGVAHARRWVGPEATAEQIADYLQQLPRESARRVEELGLPDSRPLTRDEVAAAARERRDDFDLCRPKVFGIGLERTGNRALVKALDRLGIEVAHNPVDLRTLTELRVHKRGLAILDHYQGLTSIAAAARFRELDAAYIGARFILTVRDKRAWIASIRRRWEELETRRAADPALTRAHHELWALARQGLYGSERFDEQALSAAWDRHIAQVRLHFHGRPDSLLVLDIAGGEGWDRLAPFLGCEVPDEPFPRVGGPERKVARWRHRDRAVHTARASLRWLGRRARQLTSR